MSTAGDEALEKALEHLKVRNADYLQNQTPVTDSNLAGAMGRQCRALASTKGMVKQASEMHKVKEDFENTRNPRKKTCIADKLANTLVNMTVKKLARWAIQGAISSTGVAYAMYDISTNGEIIDWTDTNGDGVLDMAIVDTNEIAGGEFAIQDVDGNGTFDRVMELNDNGAIEEVVAEGSVVESVFGMSAIQDRDGGGIIDSILDVGDNGAIEEVVAEGSVVESVFGMLGSVFEAASDVFG